MRHEKSIGDAAWVPLGPCLVSPSRLAWRRYQYGGISTDPSDLMDPANVALILTRMAA